MPQPLALPVRVLVKGASTVGSVSPAGGPRSDFTFPRVIEAELLAAGRPAEVRSYTVPSEQAKTTLTTWESEIFGWSPDVVVLVYGHYETIHLFLPHWLERHVNSLKARPGRLRELYRARLLRPVWMTLAKLQARADTKVPLLRSRRPRQVAADLQTLIGHLQSVGSPLVYLVELLPPAKRRESWFPGMAARIEEMNRHLRAMVERQGRDNVRWFPVVPHLDAVAGGDLDLGTPDGFHYSPELHRAIGVALAREIGQWADGQPHLRPARVTRSRRAAAATPEPTAEPKAG